MKLIESRSPSSNWQRHSHVDGGGISHHYSAEELHNDDVAHEESDISIRAIIWSAVAITVVCFSTAALMYLMFWQLESQAAARDPQLSPLAMPTTVMSPTTTASPEFGSAPEPRLLTNEPEYLKRLRDGERYQLGEYGWVDEKAGVARIPVEQAKQLILKRGLPARTDLAIDPRLGARAPAAGESSSGRSITRPKG